jgi:transcriptional regulator with XRE-family HTH domain
MTNLNQQNQGLNPISFEQTQSLTEINHTSEASFAGISFGELLRKKRQNLKMEISDVSSYLRIKINDIEAIENDEIEKIAKHIYAPGLIRSYAKFLKFDPKEIEENFRLLSFKSNTENKKHMLINIGENIDLTPDRDSVVNFLLISVLLFLALLSIYNSSDDKRSLISTSKLVAELEKITNADGR